MATLWMKFPDEVLLCHIFTDETQKNLEHIFSNSDSESPWMQSLSLLGMSVCANNEPMIKWYNSAPYFNWSLYTNMISGGGVRIVKIPDGGYKLSFSYNIKHVIALVVTQWKIARFLAKSPKIEEPLVESIILGIALQGLIMRLGSDDNLAKWLASPETVPKKHKRTIEQIQSIQMRRTQITDVWSEQFAPSANSENSAEGLPEYFWDDQIPEIKSSGYNKDKTLNDTIWRGKSVCSGNVTGIAVLVDSDFDLESLKDMCKLNNAPIILIFKSARPETIELFEHADAVVFCNGGVLSHACTIARDMNIPCITALGSDFLGYVQNHEEHLWLQIDANDGKVIRFESVC